MGYLLSDYSISYFPDNGTGYHPLYQDTTNSIVYELLGVKPKEMIGRSSITGFTEVYSICGALIKVNNRYTPMVISTSPSGCRVRNNSTQEVGSYKQVKYNGYGYYVCDNIPGLADNITVQGMILKSIDKNYNSIEEAVIDFLSQLDKLPTPCVTVYLLPEPISKRHSYFSEYNSILYSGAGAAFYAKPITSTEEWQAIGAILRDTTGYYHPIVISSVRDYVKLLDTQFVVNNSNIVEFEYNGFTYYINSTISQSVLTKGTSTTIGSETIYVYSGPYASCEFIPYDNSSEEKIIEMGKSLLAQYEFEGGKLKSVVGKISAIKDLDEKGNSRGKTFARTHAKIVYTDYYKGKTLDQDLEEIRTAIKNMGDSFDVSDKMDKENPTGSGAFSLNRAANTTIGVNSFVEGYNSIASGAASHAEGDNTNASGSNSHTEGYSTSATSNSAHAEGSETQAKETYAHAEGTSTIASGIASHAEGESSTASGIACHAEGFSTVASNIYSHAEGNNSQATSDSAHAEGSSTTASGSYSHAEGRHTSASVQSSHAEGENTNATGYQSHAEGLETLAQGKASHAEGWSTIAGTESAAHAEGYLTKATGSSSHAEGSHTEASTNCAHAEGYYTIAASPYQHVEGKCNIEDTENKYAHIIGGGTNDTARKNIHTVDWDGNAYYMGTITCKKVIMGDGSSVDISELIEYGNDITD